MQPSLYAIDFGTSNSLLVAVNAEHIDPPLALDPLARDPSVFRSISCFSEGTWSFGAAALERYVSEGMQGRFLRSLKRFLPMLSFNETRIGTKSVTLEALVGLFLREMK
ncbi:MAG TPA: Hsp70 family protein, partial [Polyangiaceae bacterium]|nr:Hsp70 family protein [Polyangiaceae bacterium]